MRVLLSARAKKVGESGEAGGASTAKHTINLGSSNQTTHGID